MSVSNWEPTTPPDGVPLPGTETRPQVLPFGNLTWENFERLCYRLAGKDSSIESYARYGRVGQAQHGIDVFARRRDGAYNVWQAKHHATFSASKLKAAVTVFLKGAWKTRASVFVLAVRCSLDDVRIRDAIEVETARLKAQGIGFLPMGAEELSEALRESPTLVSDFFGRWWARAFLGEFADRNLLERLDGAEFAKARKQLGAVYKHRFEFFDPIAHSVGGKGPSGPSLLQRFTPMDVWVGERLDKVDALSSSAQSTPVPASGDPLAPTSPVSGAARKLGEWSQRRISLNTWLEDGENLAVVADAGRGKSTLLRCIALDLIAGQKRFVGVASRWGDRIPIHIPFARWVRLSTEAGSVVGLKEVVSRTLQPLVTAELDQLVSRAIEEKRILLLIDGLDEWAEEQAARSVFEHIMTLTAAHGLSVVVTGRPRGLNKIGAIPHHWKVATLAPLSPDQQRTLVTSRLAMMAAADEGGKAEVAHQVDRFMSQVERERAISALAEVPLLLVGLVTLSLRQVELPRSKHDAYAQLVNILIDSHPKSRATASGDTQDRFTASSDPKLRRAALARLAFEIRCTGADSGFANRRAKEVMKLYLSSSETWGLSEAESNRAAAELLAVNAETQGLVVEKAPDEIGFAHGSFEEFLSAIHLSEWSLPNIRSFLVEHAAGTRWRNVIVHLLAMIGRRDEVDSLIQAIESMPTTPADTITKHLLLAEIAFSACSKTAATSERLVARAFETIEVGDWMPGRVDALEHALENMTDPAIGKRVRDRFSAWVPKRLRYMSSLIDACDGWPPSPELWSAFWRAMHDEDRGVQRAAARSCAKVFAGSERSAELVERIGETVNLSAAATLLECLLLGWPEHEALPGLCEQAADSEFAALSLVGTFGRIRLGHRDPIDRERLIHLIDGHTTLDYGERPLGEALLADTWPDDDDLIARCLESIGRRGPARSRFDYDFATSYLLRTSPTREAVRSWLRDEFNRDYPLNSLYLGANYSRVWAFAQADEKLKQRITEWLAENDLTLLHMYVPLIISARPEGMRERLVERVRKGRSFDDYWALYALLEGWGATDSVVAELLNEIGSWPDDRILNLLSLAFHIWPESSRCRERLLHIATTQSEARNDLLARGFTSINVDGSDSEVASLLLHRCQKANGRFDGAAELFRNFHASSVVRAFAKERIAGSDEDLPAIAEGFGGDEAICSALMTCITPLPSQLRSKAVDAAGADPETEQFALFLRRPALEADTELSVRMSILRHRQFCNKHMPQDALDALVREMKAVGPDFETRRAAALGGLIACERLGETRALKDGERRLEWRMGGYSNESHSLLQLISNKWAYLVGEFGLDFLENFNGDNKQRTLSQIAIYTADSAVHEAFVDLCEREKSNLGIPALRALAHVRPGSDVLKSACLVNLERIKDTGHYDDAPLRLQAEIAYLLRDHFPKQDDVTTMLEERLSTRRGGADAMVLAIYDADHPYLRQLAVTPQQAGTKHRQWTVALVVGGAILQSADFVELVRSMVNRDLTGPWDHQQHTNRAVVDRIRQDSASRALLLGVVRGAPTSSEVASLPKFLSAAGGLDEELRSACSVLLGQYKERRGIQTAGFDAIVDEIRSVSLSLMDTLHGAPGLTGLQTNPS
jgi:hypothetical protein